MKINNNLKVSPPHKFVKSSPARTPTKSIKSHKPIAESTPVNNSNNQQQKTTKETSEAKSFISFTENLDESLNEEASILEQEEEAAAAATADMNKSEGIEIVIE